ncbi:calmodulin-binding protein 25-like [Prosopis cineraria]|uniref:calmodulin-binding protein 25-like n=1 Tax=Prosopis cineraria TaxID=364024 RepID=UPI00240F3162|nr:calmodulin-binding protein 25-like [Prosopis cineraria]
MCSSGGKEYDSRAEHYTPGPASFDGSTHFDSFFSLVSQSPRQNPNLSFFDPSPNYFHSLSQSHPAASVPDSEPTCTHLPDLPLSSSSSSFLSAGNQSVGGCCREAVREHDNAVRNSKKRSRASRRAPTTVLTTDTSNFRSMVQEFTGIPAPPSSAASHSSRFHPFRPSPWFLHPQNPSLTLSSSSNINTTASPSKNVVDLIGPPSTTHNSSASHQLPPDLGFAFQAPLPLPLPERFSSNSQPSGSGYEPCSAESPFSEWPINATSFWPSHF